jgi:hypothetical protein
VHCCALCHLLEMLYTLATLTTAENGTLMALKPPPPWEILQQVSEFVGGKGVKEEIDKNMRLLGQSALTRLDMVSREEFDAQAAALKRTRDRVAVLEATLEELNQAVEALTGAR